MPLVLAISGLAAPEDFLFCVKRATGRLQAYSPRTRLISSTSLDLPLPPDPVQILKLSSRFSPDKQEEMINIISNNIEFSNPNDHRITKIYVNEPETLDVLYKKIIKV